MGVRPAFLQESERFLLPWLLGAQAVLRAQDQFSELTSFSCMISVVCLWDTQRFWELWQTPGCRLIPDDQSRLVPDLHPAPSDGPGSLLAPGPPQSKDLLDSKFLRCHHTQLSYQSDLKITTANRFSHICFVYLKGNSSWILWWWFWMSFWIIICHLYE